MNKLKIIGGGMIALGKLTTQDWILIISIIITILGMIQDYLKDKKTS